MGQLPSDVLLLLFEAAVDLGATIPEILMRVCHRWRALVKGEQGSALWAVHTVKYEKGTELRAISRLSHHLALSRQAKLSLRFTFAPLAELVATKDLASSEVLLALLDPHLDRIRTLSIDGGVPWRFLRSPPPPPAGLHLSPTTHRQRAAI